MAQGRWVNGFESFDTGNGLKVVVECSQGQSTPNEVTAQKGKQKKFNFTEKI